MFVPCCYGSCLILKVFFLPCQPPEQEHVNALTKFKQVPLLEQGFEAHSSISASHLRPVKPGKQLQE